MNFLKSYGYMDPILILIQIPHLLHLERKLFESRGCLLLVSRDDISSSEFTIYEMMIGCSVWIVMYRVDTNDFITPLPEGWSIWSTVWSVVLGERGEDSFLVINSYGKVVQCNLISKTLYEIYDCGSNQLDDNHDDDDEILQQFKAEHNVNEFISSFAILYSSELKSSIHGQIPDEVVADAVLVTPQVLQLPRPNGKLIHNSIINGPYVRRMIPEPGDPNREVPMNETFHVQSDNELTEKELKQIEADDQAI
nr:hypothetical protein [Tanacetum cinerariifolium]